MKERKGNWFQTFTNKMWWPQDPHPEDVDILDIAHALSQQCRFNGMSSEFYSVAQHSVIVSDLVRIDTNDLMAAYVGLLHDAAEAYVGDLIKPIKIHLSNFQDLEELNLQVIMESLGAPDFHTYDGVVKKWDIAAICAERIYFMPKPPIPYDLHEKFDGNVIKSIDIIESMSPAKAKNMFLSTYFNLRGKIPCLN